MKEKFKGMLSTVKRNVGKLAISCVGIVSMLGACFAAEGDPPSPPTPPTTSDFQTLMSKITDTFTPTVILQIMGAIVAFGVVYALLYWGARKALRAGFSAVKRGKVRV